jgi:hypothetical protein
MSVSEIYRAALSPYSSYTEALPGMFATYGSPFTFNAMSKKNDVLLDVTPCGSCKKTPFFIVTTVKTSNLTTL